MQVGRVRVCPDCHSDKCPGKSGGHADRLRAHPTISVRFDATDNCHLCGIYLPSNLPRNGIYCCRCADIAQDNRLSIQYPHVCDTCLSQRCKGGVLLHPHSAGPWSNGKCHWCGKNTNLADYCPPCHTRRSLNELEETGKGRVQSFRDHILSCEGWLREKEHRFWTQFKEESS